MDYNHGYRRRTAEWDEIEEAPQIKRFRDDVKIDVAVTSTISAQPVVQPQQQENNVEMHQEPQQEQAQPQQEQQQPQVEAVQPKFYISAPIQGFTSDGHGGCRYLFF
ncbi:unnamed protein product [Caenorhabditis auriculariae]|uniref:Uncharacterized protein n=1 Tax=Caenorhabditis auriculariae TaxID=2777116 RepID=A0A8S1HVZ3_9PELO|nr:unnamed protein product [Caenorhabditis auriculariae]